MRILLAILCAAALSLHAADTSTEDQITIALLKWQLAQAKSEIASLNQRLAAGSAAYQQLSAGYQALLQHRATAPAPAVTPPLRAPTYSILPGGLIIPVDQ